MNAVLVPENQIKGALVEGYVKIANAAKMLGVSARTVNHWIHLGYFPGAVKNNPRAKTGSPYWIPEEDIAKFLEERKNPPNHND